ncbi:MAG: phosphodiester glycosidase family protein [Eubacteriales bacterium]|nr:phosphodiester glycosidase family protein [Eubacteriales bacterium]
MYKKILKTAAVLLLLLLLGAGAWAADYFLIPKAEQTGVAPPLILPEAVSASQTDGSSPDGSAASADASSPAGDASQTDGSSPAGDASQTDGSDRFPIMADHFPEEAVDQPVQAGEARTDDPEGTTVIGASDGDYKIVVTKTVTGSGDDRLTYYVADILVPDARMLKSCFAQDTYGENIYETTDSMAKRCQAVLAVNGDFYGWRSDGIIIRNGSLFRDVPARRGAAIYEDGYLRCFDESSTSGEALLEEQVWSTFSFGPELVQDGQVVDGLDEDYAVDLLAIQHKQPRTVIGQIARNHFVLVVVDGRQAGYSRGIRMTELASLMQELGCTEAYNLDGGASSTMYFKGEIVNHPCSGDGDRNVSDCIFLN